MSITYSEIKLQYDALRQTFDYMQSRREDIVAFFGAQAPSSVTVVGCGSSYCLSEAAAFSFKLRAGLPAVALAGGDLMLHAGDYGRLLAGTLLVVPSRSGSTSEIVEAVKRCRENGPLPVLAVSCVTGSPLSQMADLVLELPWAFDSSVCQTRTITNLYAANLLIAAYLGGDEALVADIGRAAREGEAYMERVEQAIRGAAGGSWTNAVVLADGELYGLAAEGAIALTEIAGIQAHAYHLLDVRHGPMVTVGADTLVIALLTGQGQAHQRKLMSDLAARGAAVIAFANSEALIPADEVTLAVRPESELLPAAQGIPFMFIPQIAALTSAERQGIQPDNPDGLTAWVKL